MTTTQQVQRNAPTQLDEQKIARLSQPEISSPDMQSGGESSHSGAVQRASLDPNTLTPQDAHYLQRTIGNAGLTTLLQNRNGGDGASIQRTPTQINFQRSIQRMSEHVDSLAAQGQRMSNGSDSIQRTGTPSQSGPIIQRNVDLVLTTRYGVVKKFSIMSVDEVKAGAGDSGGPRYNAILAGLAFLHNKTNPDRLQLRDGYVVEGLITKIDKYLRAHKKGKRSPTLRRLKSQLDTINVILDTAPIAPVTPPPLEIPKSKSTSDEKETETIVPPISRPSSAFAGNLFDNIDLDDDMLNDIVSDMANPTTSKEKNFEITLSHLKKMLELDPDQDIDTSELSGDALMYYAKFILEKGDRLLQETDDLLDDDG
ncbi:MAG: hypothetical protein AAF639_31235 [Chloroflexota bacterium]